MISNNLTLLSHNLRPKYPAKYASNPQRIAIKHKYQLKIKQSHDNLFNFINDTFNA